MDCNMVDQGDVDNTDARGIFGVMKSKIPAPVSLRGNIDSDEYSMAYPKRGRCLIFNHKTFDADTKLNVRNGTEADAVRLYCRFKSLGFDTEVFKDITVREVNDVLKKEGKKDHSECSSFVCCVLSHGDYGILYARDGKYPTDNIFAPFRGDVCPSLLGKPKMFFIQACQGDKLDSGVNAECDDELDSTFKIPSHADFLIVYSTVPGFYSWRNTTHGSWFIQALCAAIEEHAQKKDLLSILTIVNRKVAFDFESCTPQDPSMHMKKQVPLITSSLTRDIRWFPSS